MKVEQAIQQVNRDYFVLQENGKMLPNTTSTKAIKKHLQFLEIREGDRVLEIGTGSGYSTALIAELIGQSGKVTSIDIDPAITERAKSKLSSYAQIECIIGDGREGYQSNAPYNRVIAWTSTEYLPDSWGRQLAEAGFIVAPFRILTIADSMVMVRLKKDSGNLKGDRVEEGSYIPMTSEPVVNFFGHEVFAELVGEGEHPYWASSHWMKKTSTEKWEEKILQSTIKSSPFEPIGEDVRAFLLTKNPDGLTTAFHLNTGFWIGYSSPNGFALLSYDENKWVVSDDQHAKVLSDWINHWERLGKPSYEHLEPIIVNKKISLKFKGGI
ncbi:protein-L-isoaspartate O-methyltransferase family protein [Thermoflavimicrobium daqui]|nr:methyltransferase domain-containing protein [Thermoflavimicrobium daqui]